METFQIPLREIERRFTWSELVLMGWRSQEQAYQLRSKSGESVESEEEPKRSVEPRVTRRVQRKDYDGVVPANLPDRFFDENGEVNLSKVGVKDAVKYMHALGFKIPPGGGAVGG